MTIGPSDPTTATPTETLLYDFASFKTRSPLYKFTQLLEKRKVRLELKRRDCVLVLVKFIALPFPFLSHLKIWSFNVVVGQGGQINVQKKRDCELLFCSLNLVLFRRSHYRRCRSFVRSLRM